MPEFYELTKLQNYDLHEFYAGRGGGEDIFHSTEG